MNIFQKVTLKNLKENRTRTLVTIIGIILSAAMFTAVTVSVSSLLHYLIRHTIYNDGSWYGSAYSLPLEKVTETAKDTSVEQTAAVELLGFSMLDDSQNPNKPYLCVYGIDTGFTDMLPVHLTKGRMPENSSEILLPAHLKENGGITYNLQDVLTLTLGKRTAPDGTVLDTRMGYYPEDSELFPETLSDTSSRTYTVTGFYERPSFEDYSAPGYTALTVSDMPADGIYDIYLRTSSAKDINSFMETHFSDYGYTSNYSLLRLYGYSGESSYNTILTGLAAILTGIIMFGSISLIYNAFSISISERTRQFGLLASIGATRKQLTGSVLFEAFSLSIIGIPLGVLSGILGIGITFHFTGEMIAGFLYPNENVTLSLYPSVPALLIAVTVSLITILLSAYLPARCAMKKSSIDAIRQSNDIKIRPGKVKTSRLTQKLFGFEGMLAAKNYKRNGKKYRATVFSLFISVVLFISASTLSAYMVSSIQDVTADSGYDLIYNFHQDHDNTDYTAEDVKKLLSEASGVTASAYYTTFYLDASIDPAALSQDYINAFELETNNLLRSADFILSFVEDDVFHDYLKEHNLPGDDYFDPEHPQAVLVDALKYYNGREGRYYTPRMFSGAKDADITLYLQKEIEGYYSSGSSYDEDGKLYYSYDSNELNSDDAPMDSLKLPWEEAAAALPVSYGAILSETPATVPKNQQLPTLYYPYSMMPALFSGLNPDSSYSMFPDGAYQSDAVTVSFTFQSRDHAKSYADIVKILESHGLASSSLTDYAASTESERTMVGVVNIFSYGFIILISLIAAANVFNTISTNISLRRREFAMLKSMGLPPEGFRKMMNFECLLYGLKGLLYGLPASVLVAWLIYCTIANGLATRFFIPWYSIVIAVGSVFAVVFSTMLYSMRKIKQENIMDTLKNENI